MKDKRPVIKWREILEMAKNPHARIGQQIVNKYMSGPEWTPEETNKLFYASNQEFFKPTDCHSWPILYDWGFDDMYEPVSIDPTNDTSLMV